jgi:uncharacterized RDD family membrane protein YckC
MEPSNFQYVGFWARVGAALIDTLLLLLITVPLMLAVYGRAYWSDTSLIKGPIGLLVEWILPAVVVIAFWLAVQRTPGKMAVSAKIVDAETGNKPSAKQLVGRYLGYFVSTIPFGLGLLWVAFDRRKQGWHDKLAGTAVVRTADGSDVAELRDIERRLNKQR